MHLHAPGGAPQLQGATLIIPVVALGNAGQLAVDLLVATAKAPRVGVLHDDAALPCAGADAYAHAPGLALPMELFAMPGDRLFVVQQRSPAAAGRQVELAEATARWAAQAGFAQVRAAVATCSVRALAWQLLICGAAARGVRRYWREPP
jgi:predicted ATP-grasp superfamily ATP-dependent carboligase